MYEILSKQCAKMAFTLDAITSNGVKYFFLSVLNLVRDGFDLCNHSVNYKHTILIALKQILLH